MMDKRNFNIVLALAGFFFFLTSLADASQHNATNCLGPIRFYKGLNCTPIGAYGDSGCPQLYNCDDWKNLSDNECMINGNKYQSGENLRDEDKNNCDICLCGGGGRWFCSSVSCRGVESVATIDEEAPICYQKQSPTECCPGPSVCLKKGEKRPTCVVDGKTYQDGEFFTPSSEPEKDCYCGEGYNGENVAPFCIVTNRDRCPNDLRNGALIRNGCAPVYENDQSPQTDCNIRFRCPDDDDAVIKRSVPSPLSDSGPGNPDLTCKFGNLTMEIGDELNQDTNWSSACVRCVCEVPPVPTCQLRPTIECNPEEHGYVHMKNIGIIILSGPGYVQRTTNDTEIETDTIIME